jgi:hypothetical protein
VREIFLRGDALQAKAERVAARHTRDYRTAVYALLRKCAERCTVHFLYTAVGNNGFLLLGAKP